jgi:hypothetical protein
MSQSLRGGDVMGAGMGAKVAPAKKLWCRLFPTISKIVET